MMTKHGTRTGLALAGAFCLGFCTAFPAESRAAESPQPIASTAGLSAPSYADIADLADHAQLVLRAKVKKVAVLKPEQGAASRPGMARIYVEAVTENLLTGPAAVGEALRYLADVRLDAKGKVPKLAKQSVLLFAGHVKDRPGEIRLVAPDAQILWDPATDATLRQVLRELYGPDAPRRVTGVQEAIHVPGTLAGEGETQIFLKTDDGEPASITVLHHAGAPTHWGVSFSEIVATTGLPPKRDTLVWYRLACFLPRSLPPGANLSATDTDKTAAVSDYVKVLSDLGSCPRIRR
ncbi:hypothetical protein [Novosphingobium sp.]|uniref:hypothetical protein n=1 Tax=Novosphingobium sp. TaxID=1874826 RepID=UPI00286E2A31|nr:hypothetical protein [Novosphingobium sp.]